LFYTGLSDSKGSDILREDSEGRNVAAKRQQREAAPTNGLEEERGRPVRKKKGLLKSCRPGEGVRFKKGKKLTRGRGRAEPADELRRAAPRTNVKVSLLRKSVQKAEILQSKALRTRGRGEDAWREADGSPSQKKSSPWELQGSAKKKYSMRVGQEEGDKITWSEQGSHALTNQPKKTSVLRNKNRHTLQL